MTIAPSDAAVAARSFPRRWRALFARAAGDDEHQDVLTRSGAVELANRAVAELESIVGLLPHYSAVRKTSGGDVLVRLEDAASQLADHIDAVPGDRWAPDDLLGLDAAIQRVAGLLREAERAIDAALRA